MAFYRISKGGYLSQVHSVCADCWSDAKEAAFPFMEAGDIVCEADVSSIKENAQFPKYRTIAEEDCAHYAELMRGTWATLPSGKEYFEERAFYWSDEVNGTIDNFYDLAYEQFEDWRESEASEGPITEQEMLDYLQDHASAEINAATGNVIYYAHVKDGKLHCRCQDADVTFTKSVRMVDFEEASVTYEGDKTSELGFGDLCCYFENPENPDFQEVVRDLTEGVNDWLTEESSDDE